MIKLTETMIEPTQLRSEKYANKIDFIAIDVPTENKKTQVKKEISNWDWDY